MSLLASPSESIFDLGLELHTAPEEKVTVEENSLLSEARDQDVTPITEDSSKLKDSIAILIDALHSCFRNGMCLKLSCMGSLKVPKPAKTFLIHFLVESVLYGDWLHPGNIFTSPKMFFFIQ